MCCLLQRPTYWTTMMMARTHTQQSRYFKMSSSTRVGASAAMDVSSSRSSLSTDPTVELKSYMDQETRDCKAFRILVCGKSGVGKTALISRVFNVGSEVSTETINVPVTWSSYLGYIIISDHSSQATHQANVTCDRKPYSGSFVNPNLLTPSHYKVRNLY